MANRTAGEAYFRVMAYILLAIIIAGFGSVQLLAPSMAGPLSGIVMLHAAVFLGWYALLIIQPKLIERGDIALHRKIGVASLALALAIIVVGFFVIQGAYARPGWSIAGLSRDASAIIPTIDIVLFALFYGLAFANRSTPAAHKRLMLLAGLIMIDPAASRLVLALGGPPPMIALLEIALFLSLPIYDYRSLKRVHWASLFGVLAIFASGGIKFGLGSTDAWLSLAPKLFG